MTEASRYPLTWPPGRKRTTFRDKSRFKTSFAAARNALLRELELMGAKDVILSTNVPLRLDLLPYAKYSVSDPGVAVYFTRKGRKTAFACDRWNTVGENLHAVAKTIEALRGIERWGSSETVDAAFTGFAALPPAVITERPWRDALGFGHGFSDLPSAEERYRHMAAAAHPDHGGSHDRMAELNRAIAAARKELAK